MTLSVATSSATIYRRIRFRLYFGHPPTRSGVRSMNPTSSSYGKQVGEHCNPEFGPPVTIGLLAAPNNC